MAGAVNLQDIVDDLSMMLDGIRSFVDRETGEVIPMAIADLGAAEDGEEEDDSDPWVCDIEVEAKPLGDSPNNPRSGH
jgi:hypothetical protein